MKCHNFKKESVKQSRLKSYLALTAGFAAITPLADAQIIYTDVNPDSVLTGNESLQLDINNDGIFDFTIKEESYYWGPTKVYGNSVITLNSNGIMSAMKVANSEGYYVPARLNFGDDLKSIKYIIKWGNGGRLFFTQSKPRYDGLWKGMQDKYLGFHLKINNNLYYGWARLDVAVDGKSVIIKDYAYNSKAGKSILAGSTKVSLPDENPLKNIRVYATAGSIRIEAPTDQKLTGKIRLRDINGRELSSVDVKNENNINLNTQELATGVYIVNIITEKGTLNKRVLIR